MERASKVKLYKWLFYFINDAVTNAFCGFNFYKNYWLI